MNKCRQLIAGRSGAWINALAFVLRNGQVDGPYGGPQGNPFPFTGNRCEFLYFGGTIGQCGPHDTILKSLNFYFNCDI